MVCRRLVQVEPSHLDEFLRTHDGRLLAQVSGIDGSEFAPVRVDEVEDSEAEPCQLVGTDGQTSLLEEFSACCGSCPLIAFDQSAGEFPFISPTVETQ